MRRPDTRPLVILNLFPFRDFTPMSAYLNVQCTEESGKVGCFLTESKGKQDRKAISPIFPDLVDTFAWMRENGWKLDEYTSDGFDPWRVSNG